MLRIVQTIWILLKGKQRWLVLKHTWLNSGLQQLKQWEFKEV